MIENEIHCYVNGFLKWKISKKTTYIVGNKKVARKICVLNLRNKRKSIFSRVIIQPDKIRKSEIFTTFEKIHRSFINSLKSEETKKSDKSTSVVSCQFLILQLQVFSTSTKSTPRFRKLQKKKKILF